MRELTITIPDNIFDSVKNMLQQIPELKIQENNDIPEWHKAILDERYEAFLKNPNRGRSFKEFKDSLISDGKI
jgi:hypothetical protein